MSLSPYLASTDRYLHLKHLALNSDGGFPRCILISKCNKVYTLNMYSFLYVNHTSIQKFRKKYLALLFSVTISQKVTIRHLWANVEWRMGPEMCRQGRGFFLLPQKAHHKHLTIPLRVPCLEVPLSVLNEEWKLHPSLFNSASLLT